MTRRRPVAIAKRPLVRELRSCAACGQTSPILGAAGACPCGAVDVTVIAIPLRRMTPEEMEAWVAPQARPIGTGPQERVQMFCPSCLTPQQHIRRRVDQPLACPRCLTLVLPVEGVDGAVL